MVEREKEAGEPAERRKRAGYEPPALTLLGSLAELTRGIVPTTTDGVLPGSVVP